MRITEYKIITLVMLLYCATGCGICRRCPRGDVAQHDSIYVHTTETVSVHDTVIFWRIPEGTASASLPDSDTSRLKTALAESVAWVADGRLHHDLWNRSDLRLPVMVPIMSRAVETNTGRLSDRVVTVEVEKKLSRWQQFWIRFGQCAAVILVFIIAGFFIRSK